MPEQIKIVLPKSKKELKEISDLINEGKVSWGGEQPTKEQLDKYPLSYFDEEL